MDQTSLNAERRFRGLLIRRVGSLQTLMQTPDAPITLVAAQVLLVLKAATGLCGKRLYEMMGKMIEDVVLEQAGYCTTCRSQAELIGGLCPKCYDEIDRMIDEYEQT